MTLSHEAAICREVIADIENRDRAMTKVNIRQGVRERLGRHIDFDLNQIFSELWMAGDLSSARADFLRAPISLETRASVWDKTGGICSHCGKQTNPFRDFAVDHRVALTGGGTNDIDNLIPSCRSCNAAKGACEARASQTRRKLILGAA